MSGKDNVAKVDDSLGTNHLAVCCDLEQLTFRPCSHGYDIVQFHFGPFQKVVRRGVAFTRVRKKIKRSVPKQVQKLGGTEK